MTLREKIAEATDKTKTWITEHQGDIIYGAYIAACIGAVVIPAISKARKNSMDYNRGKRIYDRSNDFYWEIRRNPTNNEKLIIEQRRMMGESLGHILSDMRLLKR